MAPSEKITLAHIGMGTQGFSELGNLLSRSADPDRIGLRPEHRQSGLRGMGPEQHSTTHPRVPGQSDLARRRTRLSRRTRSGTRGGRYVLLESTGRPAFRACSAYADFRELLDKETDVDAVKIMTPTILHATIAIAAMKRGKHVAVHKPIANRLLEGRKVVRTARETQVATHLLAYGSGSGNEWICQRIKEGVIGPLREVHNWTNRPVWPQYTELPKDRPPVPQGTRLGPVAGAGRRSSVSPELHAYGVSRLV